MSTRMLLIAAVSGALVAVAVLTGRHMPPASTAAPVTSPQAIAPPIATHQASCQAPDITELERHADRETSETDYQTAQWFAALKGCSVTLTGSVYDVSAAEMGNPASIQIVHNQNFVYARLAAGEDPSSINRHSEVSVVGQLDNYHSPDVALHEPAKGCTIFLRNARLLSPSH